MLRHHTFVPSRISRQVGCPAASPAHVAHDSAEGDFVLLRERQNSSQDGILVKLWPSKETFTHRGFISHTDIIGKEPRQIVQSSNGAAYRIYEPTLAEYVRFTPRIVTPVRLLRSDAAPRRAEGLG